MNIWKGKQSHNRVPLPMAEERREWRISSSEGWRLNGTYQANSGAPSTPVIGGDPLGPRSTDPYDVPNRLAVSGCGNPVNSRDLGHYLKLQVSAFPNPSTLLGNLARNSIIGPSLTNVDVSLFKDKS